MHLLGQLLAPVMSMVNVSVKSRIQNLIESHKLGGILDSKCHWVKQTHASRIGNRNCKDLECRKKRSAIELGQQQKKIWTGFCSTLGVKRRSQLDAEDALAFCHDKSAW